MWSCLVTIENIPFLQTNLVLIRLIFRLLNHKRRQNYNTQVKGSAFSRQTKKVNGFITRVKDIYAAMLSYVTSVLFSTGNKRKWKLLQYRFKQDPI